MEHKGTQTIETERLILRRFKLSDAQNMFDNYASKSKVTEYMTWLPHKDVGETADYLRDCVLPQYEKHDTYRWAIVLKETGEVIGSIDAFMSVEERRRVEVGWVLGDEYWGRGIMPEAATSVLEYLFSVGYERVQATHNVLNPKSGRVMEKIGMRCEGTLRKYSVNNSGVLVDCKMWAITDDDFSAIYRRKTGNGNE